jgi:hypothetical protein
MIIRSKRKEFKKANFVMSINGFLTKKSHVLEQMFLLREHIDFVRNSFTSRTIAKGRKYENDQFF